MEVLTNSMVCWFQTSGVPWVKSETDPHTRRARRDGEEEAEHSRLVDGRFNKQGNWYMRLVLGGCKTSRFSAPTRTWKVYIEALPGFIYIFSPGDLNNTLPSQGCVLENGSYCGHGGQNTPSKDRGGGDKPSMPGSSSWVKRQSRPLDYLVQQSGNHLVIYKRMP